MSLQPENQKDITQLLGMVLKIVLKNNDIF